MINYCIISEYLDNQFDAVGYISLNLQILSQVQIIIKDLQVVKDKSFSEGFRLMAVKNPDVEILQLHSGMKL